MKHSGYLTTSGAEIYYEQYGSGTPLLILHGNNLIKNDPQEVEFYNVIQEFFIHFCARFCPIFR